MNSKKKYLLNETYLKFIQTSLNELPLDGIEEFIDQNVMGYGTTLNEKILSISDYRDLVIRQREQGKDIKTEHDLTPVVHKIATDGNSAVFVDEIVLKMFIQNEIHKLFIRLSTVLEYRDQKWIVVHWHGSKPEYEQGETDTWHVNEWKQKNAELEKLVEEKTADLIIKNRELEIESALERVRSRSMAMHKSEELLEVANVLFQELRNLGCNLWASGVVICKADSDNDEVWFANEKGVLPPIAVPHTEDPVHKKMYDGWKKKIDLLSVTKEGQELKAHYDYMLSVPTVKPLFESILASRLSFPSLQTWYAAYFKYGYLLTITLDPYPEEQVFVRFAKVFNQAYTRFLDLQKAEAQAREAQIESALEKVRSQTMGMQSSEELGNVATVMFDQLRLLGGELFSCGIVLCDENKNEVEQWHCIPGAGMMDPFHVPYNLDYIHQYRYDQWKLGTNLFSIEIHEDIITQHFDTMLALHSVKAVWEGITEKGLALPEIPTWEIDYGASFQYGYLLISALQPFEEASILPRFAKVFEQTYTRFLDLQKAEARVKEAKVEVALERVRASAMAMHKSEDLSSSVSIVFSELNQLGFNTIRCGIGIFNDKSRYVNIWTSSSKKAQLSGDEVLEGHPLLEGIYNAWQNQVEYSYVLKGKELLDYYKVVAQSNLPESGPEINNENVTQFYHVVNFPAGGLFAFRESEFSDEVKQLMKRFGDVFNLAFTRHLDLKKAEAQAREAQIEAALERVRSGAMAMHKSEEVGAVSDVLFSELNKLNFDVSGCSVVVIDEEKDKMELWRARSDIAIKPFESASFSEFIDISKKNMPDWSTKFFNALRKRKDNLIDELSAKRRLQFINVIAAQYHYSSNEKSKLLKNAPGKIVTHFIFFKLGYLALLSENKLPEENLSIARRFIEVFDFAYTRFLDINKAEAQAREAQIEVALERVRARSMAMHKSGELADLSYELVKQVQALGVATWFCAFNIYDEDQSGSLEWGSNAEGTYPNYRTPREGIFLRYYESGQRGETLLINEIVENECAAHYKYLCSLPGVGEQLLKMKDAGIPFPTSQIDHVAYFKYGYIIFITYEPVPEAHDVFKRFAKVFEQTYTRFLDLEKAEAQAREAQIEAALDKVRARTMAMQKSRELAQTAAHLFEQLNHLGIKPYRCSIAIVDVKSVSCRLWSTTNSGNVIPTGSALPLTEYSVMQNMYDGWKTQKSNHVIKLAGEERLAWIKYISKYLPFDEYKPQNIKEEFLLKEAAFFSNIYFKQGFFAIHTSEKIIEDQLQVIQRFAKVFEQTYTRFLDLENAETQNKLIQAENERKTQELEEARELQLAMLPKELPQLPNIEIAVYMKTATEVGGDYYDFHVSDNGILTGVIGDATGHGMKAGTIVTITKSLFNNLAPDESILNTFSKISKVIKDMNFRQLSMCLMMFKIEANIISISSAAMPPTLIYRTKNNIVEEFELRGMPLGAMNNFPYKLVETKLHKGDTILLMSDGFPELMNEEKGMYGYDRTKSIFHSLGENTPEEIVEQLKISASDWVDDKDPDDDVTFVVIKIK